jgi:hypothetical protein
MKTYKVEKSKSLTHTHTHTHTRTHAHRQTQTQTQTNTRNTVELQCPWKKIAANQTQQINKKPTAEKQNNAPAAGAGDSKTFFADEVTYEKEVDYDKIDEDDEGGDDMKFTAKEREVLLKLPRR